MAENCLQVALLGVGLLPYRLRVQQSFRAGHESPVPRHLGSRQRGNCVEERKCSRRRRGGLGRVRSIRASCQPVCHPQTIKAQPASLQAHYLLRKSHQEVVFGGTAPIQGVRITSADTRASCGVGVIGSSLRMADAGRLRICRQNPKKNSAAALTRNVDFVVESKIGLWARLSSLGLGSLAPITSLYKGPGFVTRHWLTKLASTRETKKKEGDIKNKVTFAPVVAIRPTEQDALQTHYWRPRTVAAFRRHSETRQHGQTPNCAQGLRWTREVANTTR